MKCAAAFMGTPGALFSAVGKAATFVLIDRNKDTWERVFEGEHRYAIQAEPSRKAITVRSAAQGREEIARLAALGRRELESEMLNWWWGG